MITPKDKKFYMPAEWHTHENCWMQWPHYNQNFNSYGDIPTWSFFDIDKAHVAWSNVAKSIAKFEKVKMIVNSDDINKASELLNNKNIEIIKFNNDDCWARDSGSIFLLNHKNELGGVDWEFNGWGKFKPFDSDNKIAKMMIDSNQAYYFKNNMILEGGSIHVDGQGKLITTEQCLLNKNRNPNFTKEEIEFNLREFLGVSKIIRLKYGIDEGTDGHIDNVACFIKPGVVMALSCLDKNDPFYEKLNENIEVLKTSVDVNNKYLKIIPVEMSYKRHIKNSYEPSSYINFYMANNSIIMPSFNDERSDIKAQQIIQKSMPDRKVIAINTIDVLMGGGNIHCITQQQPKSKKNEN